MRMSGSCIHKKRNGWFDFGKDGARRIEQRKKENMVSNVKRLIAVTVSMMAVASFVHASVIVTYCSFDSSTSQVDAGTLVPILYPTLVSITNTAKVGAGSLKFDATTSRVSMSAGNAALLSDTPQFTVMMWAYRTADNLPNSGSEMLWADQSDNYLRLTGTATTDNLYFRGTADNASFTGPTSFSSLLNPLRTWRHIAIQYDLTAGTITRYLNGAQSGGAINISTWDDVTFGGFLLGYNGSVNAFTGLIDDFAVVKGNLTSEELAAIAGGQSVSSVIPEPATLGLLGLAAAVVLVIRRGRVCLG